MAEEIEALKADVAFLTMNPPRVPLAPLASPHGATSGMAQLDRPELDEPLLALLGEVAGELSRREVALMSRCV